jgi:hypothetical protein
MLAAAGGGTELQATKAAAAGKDAEIATMRDGACRAPRVCVRLVASCRSASDGCGCRPRVRVALRAKDAAVAEVRTRLFELLSWSLGCLLVVLAAYMFCSSVARAIRVAARAAAEGDRAALGRLCAARGHRRAAARAFVERGVRARVCVCAWCVGGASHMNRTAYSRRLWEGWVAVSV